MYLLGETVGELNVKNGARKRAYSVIRGKERVQFGLEIFNLGQILRFKRFKIIATQSQFWAESLNQSNFILKETFFLLVV